MTDAVFLFAQQHRVCPRFNSRVQSIARPIRFQPYDGPRDAPCSAATQSARECRSGSAGSPSYRALLSGVDRLTMRPLRTASRCSQASAQRRTYVENKAAVAS